MTLAANLAALARRVVGTAANNLVALDAEGRLPPVDGSLLTGLSAGGIKSVQVFTASGAYTPSEGVTKALVIVTGGGGGGYYTTSGGNLSGGGAGATAISLLDNPNPQTVTIGAGGTNASAGGTSSFGSLVTAAGGSPGGYSPAGGIAFGGAGGSATSGAHIAIKGGSGGDAFNTDTTYNFTTPGAGGCSIWGGRYAFGSGGSGANGPSDARHLGTAGVVVVLEY